MFKKKPEHEEPKLTELSKKLQTTEKSSKKPKETTQPFKAIKNTNSQKSQTHSDLKDAESPFVGVQEYSSAMKIAEKIDKEITTTKSSLGKYLRQLDNVRAIAEKSQRLYDIIAKTTGKKQTKKNAEIEINNLEIVLDATPLQELTAIERVVISHQQRLITLQETRDALKTLDQIGDHEGLLYIVLEREKNSRTNSS